MALPMPTVLEDCSSFDKTVRPFIPQLWNAVASSGNKSLFALYADTSPLVSGFAISVVLGAVFLVASEVNKNYSQVDRFWSVLPTAYIAHFAVWARAAGVPHARVDLVLMFAAAWSCRLTFNYWRKGGYQKGSEDYRWEVVKNRIPPIFFFLLNVTFISFFQSILLFLFSAPPTYAILLASRIEGDTKISDYVYLMVELGLVLSEWVSDGQQWAFQTAKKEYQKDGKVPKGFRKEDLDRGFVTSGLWAYSRHPNFAAEQLVWFVLYQWSCWSSNVLYSWTFAGCAALMGIFQGSTILTEGITGQKYAEYADYQKAVGMFLPKSPKPYKQSTRAPKIIRTSELAENYKEKEKQK